MLYISKFKRIPDLSHAGDIKVIKEVIFDSIVHGPWASLERKYPAAAARILLEQAYYSPERAKVLAAQASLWTGECEIFKFPEKPLQITAENTAHNLLGLAKHMGISSRVQENTARIAGEFAGNGDIIFGIGIIGASTAGMLFYTTYQTDLPFRITTLACLSSGRALDNEGNLIRTAYFFSG